MKFFLVNTSFAILISFTGTVLATQSPVEHGIANFDKLSREANQGNSQSQYVLGVRYANAGKFTEASRFLTKAAKSGHAAAQNHLGVFYLEGKGVDKDYKNAISLFKKSAELNNPNAQYHLGKLYKEGDGVKKNYNIAIHWFAKSANQGNAKAQYNLGVIYHDGYDGVKRNFQRAKIWYEKAVSQGNALAQNNLGVIYYNAQGVPRNLEKSFSLFKQSAEQGNTLAIKNLALFSPQDDEQYFTKVIPKNQYQNLADSYYENGDYEKAKRYFLSAAEEGNAYAQYSVGYMYNYGLGGNQNLGDARLWLEQATKQSHRSASKSLKKLNDYEKMIDLADSYYESENYSSALENYEPAAQEGYADAQYALGTMYRFGFGVKQNLKISNSWYGKAAKIGHLDAKENLEKSDGILYKTAAWMRGFFENNKEEIAIGTAIVVAAYAANKAMEGDYCFRPNDDCSSGQKIKHKKLYSVVSNELADQSNTHKKLNCSSAYSLKTFIGSIAPELAHAGVEAIFTGDVQDTADVLIDAGDLLYQLKGDNHCE